MTKLFQTSMLSMKPSSVISLENSLQNVWIKFNIPTLLLNEK